MLRAFLLLSLLACDQGAAQPAKKFDDSKAKIAENDVKKIAFELYPQWAVAHPDKACPASLADLGEYTPDKSFKDPWGNSYVMMCGPNLPAGAKGLAARSNGPDGKPDTADDIKSW